MKKTEKTTVSLFLMAVLCLTGCSGTAGASSGSEPAETEETSAIEEETEQEETAAEDHTGDPSHNPGQEYTIPFADTEKLTALGLHETKFTEYSDVVKDESCYDSVMIYTYSDIPEGDWRSPSGENGTEDYVGYGDDPYGDWEYVTTVPAGDSYVIVGYCFNIDAHWLNRDDAEEDAWEELISELNVDQKLSGVTEDQFEIHDDTNEPYLARYFVRPNSDDDSQRRLRNVRVFRLNENTTMSVRIVTDGYVTIGSEEDSAEIEMFEKLCDAFGMESPYSK